MAAGFGEADRNAVRGEVMVGCDDGGVVAGDEVDGGEEGCEEGRGGCAGGDEDGAIAGSGGGLDGGEGDRKGPRNVAARDAGD